MAAARGLLAFSAALVALSSNAAIVYYDIIVYGATPGGIAAAVTAANGTNMKVALIEPTALIGGMGGPGGIGMRDMCDGSNSGDERTAMHTWINMNGAAYNLSTDSVRQPDEYIGQANWWKLVTLPWLTLDVFTQTGIYEGPGAVTMKGTRITGLQTVNTSCTSGCMVTTWNASEFVDASYEADIVVAAGVITYTYGRESKDTYNESLAGVQPFNTFAQFQYPVNPYWPNGSLLYGIDAGPLPPVGSADTRVMPYSYRLCVSPDATHVPWPAPEGYNAGDFEVLIRYTQALNAHKSSAPTIGDIVSELKYAGYPASGSRTMRYDLCESGGSAVSSDEPTALYEAYITGNRSTRAAVAARVKYWVAGMMYTLANNPNVPSVTRASASGWGLCPDAWPENGNWPPLMYVREGVRIVGDTVSTQVNTVKGVCVPTSIGIGGWTIDVHIMNRIVGTIGGTLSAMNEGAIGFAPLPGNGSAYEMPYSMLLPRASECTNLLVPVTPSVSHIAFASVRVEPTFMQLGTAAGVAAVLGARTGADLQSIPIRQIQAGIVAAGQCVHWGNTTDCTNVGKC